MIEESNKQSYKAIKAEGGLIKAWIKGVQVEEKAMQQVLNVAKMPFIFKHVAVMPDCHWGMGATVGSVIATKGAIIPAAVGVDIGCGMLATQINLTASDLPDSLLELRTEIEQSIPHGRTDNGGKNDKGSYQDNIPQDNIGIWDSIFNDNYNKLIEKHPKIAYHRTPAAQLGTLGTGNHFIEVCLDEDQSVWLMLHTGSRGMGNKFGTYFIEKAKQDMEKYFINKTLPDQDLAYLVEDTDNYRDYILAVHLAQEYAAHSRDLMLNRLITSVQKVIKKPIGIVGSITSCHHNYISRENHFGENVWITRKGAVRAREGDLGIIPGSMGTKSYIVKGKGNKDSFCSCSHGAGRRMSRSQAQKIFSLEDHLLATSGVECRKDKDVIDETPAAYKDIDAVMLAQQDLVDVVHVLKQVLCVKG